MIPYPDQARAINDIRAQFARGARSVMFVLPTGGGKTPTAGFIAQYAMHKQRRVLFLAHRDNLIRQASETFKRIVGGHGIIAPCMPHNDDLVQIGSVKTVVRRLQAINAPDLIIIDEAHHASGTNQWVQIVKAYPNAHVVGITATPCRSDGLGLGVRSGGIFDSIVFGVSMPELIASGRLVPLDYYGSSQVHFDPVGIACGDDYAPAQVADALRKSKIVGDAVHHYRLHANGMRAIVFCVNVQMAKDTAEAFNAAGIASDSIDGKMNRHAQRAVIERLGTREIMVLTSVDVVSEGTDIPAVDCGIMMRPTASLGLYMQQVGRIMRSCAGKTVGVILDMVGNTSRHGFADQKREWALDPVESLNTRKTSVEIAKARQCEKCYRIYISGATCPHCGHVHSGARTIEMTDGELRKLERQQAEQTALALAESVRKNVRKAMTLDDWCKQAIDAGYKPAWAMMRFNQRGGRASYRQTMETYRRVKNERK